MPEERGSIYKTTANEIGEALKAKLGGDGFAPKDWSENLNLLGIASEDTEAAINSLKESEGSGERGSILLSTANAIGSMLNKKYNSQRGFSPAEWASATRKMKALEEDTKSGGIVNLKGAKEVPITSLVGTVNPTLEGVDSLTATRLGVNFWDEVWELGSLTQAGDDYASTTRIRSKNYFPIKGGATYYCFTDGYTADVHFYDETKTHISWSQKNNATIEAPANARYIRFCMAVAYGTQYNDNISINYPSTSTEYTPYVAPTTYTANLGRTIYGGSADIVKGEGVDENGDTFTFDPIPINTSGDTENFYTSNGDTSITYYEEPTPYTRGSASGMIASIPEANTEFPFTKLKATIAPSVEGVSSVVVKNEGKNLVDFASNIESIYSDLSITASPNGSISFSGTPSRTWAHLTTNFQVFIPIGTYTLSRASAESYAMYIAVKYEDNTTENISMGTSATKTFTTAKNIIQIRLDISSLVTTEEYNEVVECMLEVGSSASSYEPYKNPTTYTAELGETVYGGSVDLVSGEGESLCGKVVFDGSESRWSAYATGNGYAIPLSGMKRGTWYNSDLAISYPLNKVADNSTLGVRIGVNNDGIYVVQANTIEGVADLESFKAYLANNPLTIIYPLDEEGVISLEPQEIYPREGVNNIWNDTNGITEVGYFGE